MEVKLYNAEKLERGPMWYVIFSTIVVGVLLLSLFKHNIEGAILLFFLLGGYFYYSISSSQHIVAKVEDELLILGNKSYAWSMLRGYVLEIDKNTKKISNIVFLFHKGHVIHSFDDENDQIKQFVLALNDHLPMLGDYEQTTLQKLIRAARL